MAFLLAVAGPSKNDRRHAQGIHRGSRLSRDLNPNTEDASGTATGGHAEARKALLESRVQHGRQQDPRRAPRCAASGVFEPAVYFGATKGSTAERRQGDERDRTHTADEAHVERRLSGQVGSGRPRKHSACPGRLRRGRPPRPTRHGGSCRRWRRTGRNGSRCRRGRRWSFFRRRRREGNACHLRRDAARRPRDPRGRRGGPPRGAPAARVRDERRRGGLPAGRTTRRQCSPSTSSRPSWTTRTSSDA